MILRCFFAIVLAFTGFAVQAQTTCYEYSLTSQGSTWWGTRESVSASYLAFFTGQNPGVTTELLSITQTGGSGYGVLSYRYHLPSQAWTNSEAWFGRRGASCGPSCTAGTVSQRNISVGYSGQDLDAAGTGRLDYWPSGARNTAGTVPPGWPPVDVCIDTCKWNVGAQGDPWMSRQPTAAGMYRVSYDFTMTSTATVCTPTEAEKDLMDPTRVAPSTCPGAQGFVNGRPACIPTDPNLNNLKAIPVDKNHKEGNPTAGSVSGATDRIPMTNGDGGNKGGPPHPRDGVTVTPNGTTLVGSTSTTASGTKTSTVGEEQVACGAPGQAPCKIDESGTPTGTGKDDLKGLMEADTTRNTKLTDILSGSGKDTSWSMPAWFAPQAGCAAWNLGTLPIIDTVITVDLCPIKPYINGVMNFLWIVGTFFASLFMIERVMGSGAR